VYPILLHTKRLLTDAQRGDGLDVSLDKVPPNHTLLDPRMLEAEAFGLLDRMLGVLQDNSRYDIIVRRGS